MTPTLTEALQRLCYVGMTYDNARVLAYPEPVILPPVTQDTALAISSAVDVILAWFAALDAEEDAPELPPVDVPRRRMRRLP